ncbi:MAG: S9 family peptidase [Candidatus Aminicenantes bacterium]|nr:S9 family peptidase [Candidatus Aminicenantes bacterium]
MTRNIKCISIALCLILCLWGALSGQNGTDPVTTLDLLNMKTMSQIDVSPDGSKAVFVLTSMGQDKKGEYRYYRHLWLANLSRPEQLIQLTHGDRNDRSPQWSPDGSRIAFIRTFDKNPQIWIMSLEGGEAFRVTEAEYGADQFLWSPDGRKMLFLSQIPEWAVERKPGWTYERPGREWGDVPNWKKIEKREKMDSGKSGEDKEDLAITPKPDGTLEEIRAWLAKNASENNPRVFNRLNLQGERRLETELSYSHLFIVDAAPEATAAQITKGFQDFMEPDWSPDGTKIVCSSLTYHVHPDRIEDSELWIMNADGSDQKVLLDWNDYMAIAPQYSPDGRKILFVAQNKQERGFALTQLASIAAEGGEPTPLTFDFDRNVYGYRWSPDGKYVYFTAPDRGAFPLFRIPEEGGKVEILIGGPRGVRDFDIEGDRLLYALTEVTNPLELYAADADGKGERRMTSFNAGWLQSKKIVLPQEKWLTRPDGIKIQYWVMEPANRQPGKKHPLVLGIHGGPSAMWGPGEFTMWHEFQLLTSWGYGVVYCNPRGSGGYGFSFKKANYRNWGKGPASDILAAASEAAKLEWVNPDQQVVTGGSYAGYMTAWIVTQDHRFKAAVAQRGVYELSVFFGEGRAWRLIPNHYGGYPWEAEARKFLDANSPQTFVADIKTPLLIIHSDEDIRTGVIQSEYLYKSLKAMEKAVEYVRYPHEGHDLSRTGNPLRRMDRLNRIIEFFERYIEH